MTKHVLLFLTFLAFTAGNIQCQQEITTLEPRIAVEHELTKGQKHTYQFLLMKDQYASLIVGQKGMDILARLFGIDGKQIAEFDSELRLKGEENVELIAQTSGNYKVEIEGKDQPGRYEIRLAELRIATNNDRSLEDARKLIRESNQLLGNGDLKNNEARVMAERALAIREDILGSDDVKVADVLHLLSKIYFSLMNFENAQAFGERALSIQEKMLSPDHPDLARTVSWLGATYLAKGNASKSKQYYERALQIKEQAFGSDHPEVGRAFTVLGNYYNHMTDCAKAEFYYSHTVSIARKSFGENDPAFAKALGNLANAYSCLGDYAKAEPMFLRSTEIIEKAYGADNPKIAVGLVLIGNLYINMRQYVKAVDFFQRAVSLMEKEGDNDYAYAVALQCLGDAYVVLGEYEKAEPLIQHALARIQELMGPECCELGEWVNGLAELYRGKGDYDAS